MSKPSESSLENEMEMEQQSFYRLTCSLGARTYVERFREAANAKVFVEALVGKQKPKWESDDCLLAKRGTDELAIECGRLKEIMAAKVAGKLLHKDIKAKVMQFVTGEEWSSKYDAESDIPRFLRRRVNKAQVATAEPGQSARAMVAEKRQRFDKPMGLTDEEFDFLKAKFEPAPRASRATQASQGNDARPVASTAASAAMSSPKPPKPAGKGARTLQIVAMLKQPGGTTRDDVLKATGWPSVSMQQQAKAGGVELVVDKSSKPYRYMAK